MRGSLRSSEWWAWPDETWTFFKACEKKWKRPRVWTESVMRERKSVMRLTCMRCDMLSVLEVEEGRPSILSPRRIQEDTETECTCGCVSHLLPVARHAVSQLKYCAAGLHCLLPHAQLRLQPGRGSELLVIGACTIRTVRCSPVDPPDIKAKAVASEGCWDAGVG